MHPQLQLANTFPFSYFRIFDAVLQSHNIQIQVIVLYLNHFFFYNFGQCNSTFHQHSSMEKELMSLRLHSCMDVIFVYPV